MLTLKFSKDQVGFEHPAKGPNHCGDCKHFLGGRCAIVSGTVLAEDWCRKFSMKTCSHEGKCFGACGVQKSPAGETPKTLVSNTTGKTVTIGCGPHCGLEKSDPLTELVNKKG